MREMISQRTDSGGARACQGFRPLSSSSHRDGDPCICGMVDRIHCSKSCCAASLRLIKFDRLSENAGASQLLTKAALPSVVGTAEPVRILGRLAGIHSAGCQRTRNSGLAGANRKIFSVPAATVRGGVHHVFRVAGSQLFLSRCSAGRSECKCAVPSAAEPCGPQHHYGFRIVDGL